MPPYGSVEISPGFAADGSKGLTEAHQYYLLDIHTAGSEMERNYLRTQFIICELLPAYLAHTVTCTYRNAIETIKSKVVQAVTKAALPNNLLPGFISRLPKFVCNCTGRIQPFCNPRSIPEP